VKNTYHMNLQEFLSVPHTTNSFAEENPSTSCLDPTMHGWWLFSDVCKSSDCCQ